MYNPIDYSIRVFCWHTFMRRYVIALLMIIQLQFECQFVDLSYKICTKFGQNAFPEFPLIFNSPITCTIYTIVSIVTSTNMTDHDNFYDCCIKVFMTLIYNNSCNGSGVMSLQLVVTKWQLPAGNYY